MSRQTDLMSAGIVASVAGAIVFEVAAWLGFAMLGTSSSGADADNVRWFVGFVVLRAPIQVLLELLVGWIIYQLLRKTGHFALGLAVILPALVGFVVGAKAGSLTFGTVWPEYVQVTALAGMIGWGAAGATFWAFARDGRGASAA